MHAIKAYLVEDSSIIRENLIETLLENALVDVVGTAVDEAGAIGWLSDEAHACDVVIIDIFLKGGNGLGVLKAMQDRGDAPQRIVFSNHATAEIRARCTQLGATRVFDKSNEIDEMLLWLRRFAQSDREATALRS